jgi:hypothetical protein
MPKRYRIVGGSKFKWEYAEESDQDKTKPGKLIAKSRMGWKTEAEAEAAINEMFGKEIRIGRESRPEPDDPGPEG